jgi:hypothetical protein
MGMTYKIDQKRRVVLTRGWGLITTRDVLDLTSRLLVDPRFDPTYRSLADLRDVTDVDVDHMATVHTAVTPVFAGGTRRALVATSDVAYESATAFASFAQRSGQDVRIFRDMQLAEAWLEL